MAAALSRRRNQPKCSGRNVARDAEIARLRHMISKDAYALVILMRSDEKVIQHQLGMIARRDGLLDGGFPLGKQASEKD